jgi:hypothetical protein
MYLKCFGVVLPAVVWFVATATDPAEADHLPIQFIVSQVGNKQCIKITFEGGGDGHGIPATAGATFSANALTIIDSDAGGTGLFANEPSPSTTAFWPSGDSSVDVTFTFSIRQPSRSSSKPLMLPRPWLELSLVLPNPAAWVALAIQLAAFVTGLFCPSTWSRIS